MRAKVYVESSVISYLTARPTRDIRKLSRQVATREWWETRERFDLRISTVVLDEISRGDVNAVELRVNAIRGLGILRANQATAKAASDLIARGVVPAAALPDAEHLALAAHHRMDYLVTWNQSHISNFSKLLAIRDALLALGLRPPQIVTPEFFTEGQDDALED